MTVSFIPSPGSLMCGRCVTRDCTVAVLRAEHGHATVVSMKSHTWSIPETQDRWDLSFMLLRGVLLPPPEVSTGHQED